MRFARRVLVSATAIACAGACAQIVGLEDPSELAAGGPIDATPGTDSPGSVDGGGPTSDAPASDAPFDVTRDASCANAIFCEDFDTDASVAQWTRPDGAGSVTLVTNPVRSAPRAMRATNSGTGNAQLARIVPIVNGIACEMSVRLTAWTGEGYFFELGLDPANKGDFSYWWIDIGKQGGDALLLEYSYDGNSTTNSTAYWDASAANTWVRVRVEVRLRGGAPTARILFDGAEKAVRNIAVPSSTTYQLAIGIGTDKSATADDLFIDDVMCHEL